MISHVAQGNRTMQEYRTIRELRAWRRDIQGSLGLVPTMGALHEGHLALIRRARAENHHVGVSIFVNPRQFGDAEDFTEYPRSLERDLALLKKETVDAIFVPSTEEVYPADTTTRINAPGLADRLEGASRPGHFGGVCTVVCKLFNIFQPDRAYFGQKDAQQVVVVRKMVEDLNLPVEIVPVETVRDPDGLAVSSRNVHLSSCERRAALGIPNGLFSARERFQAGERSADVLRNVVRQQIEREPILQVEYVSLADAVDLIELDVADRPAVLSVAAQCGATRLIDNVLIR